MDGRNSAHGRCQSRLVWVDRPVLNATTAVGRAEAHSAPSCSTDTGVGNVAPPTVAGREHLEQTPDARSLGSRRMRRSPRCPAVPADVVQGGPVRVRPVSSGHATTAMRVFGSQSGAAGQPRPCAPTGRCQADVWGLLWAVCQRCHGCRPEVPGLADQIHGRGKISPSSRSPATRPRGSVTMCGVPL